MTRIDALIEGNKDARNRLRRIASEMRTIVVHTEACLMTGEVPSTTRIVTKAEALAESVRIWLATESALITAELDGAA